MRISKNGKVGRSPRPALLQSRAMRKLKNITAILIDDNDTYRYLLAKSLHEIGIHILEDIRYISLKAMQGIVASNFVIMSYEKDPSATLKAMRYVKTKLKDAKIIISVCQEDKHSVPVDQLKQRGIDGLFYKADISQEELLAMVKAVMSGKDYFQNPTKTFF